MKCRYYLILLLLAFVSLANAQIKRERKTEEDGFVWYKLSSDSSDNIGVEDLNGKTIISLDRGYTSISTALAKDGYFKVEKDKLAGLTDLSGKEIISPDRGYTYISTYEAKDGYFKVVKDKLAGLTDLSGKEIISPDRGYTSISTDEAKDGYFWVVKGGKKGACDLSGKEIISPIYEDICYFKNRGSFSVKNNNGDYHHISPSGTEITQAQPTSTTETTLFAGQYTYTGMIRTSDDFIGTGDSRICEIKVFEGRLYLNNDPASYYIGDKTVYEETGRAYGESDKFYLVTSNGSIRYVMKVPVNIPMLGTFTDVRVVYFDKGNTVSEYKGKKFSSKSNMNNMNVNAGGNYGGGSYNGGNNSGGYNSSSSQGQRSCSVCYGTGNCQTCYGSGWVSNPFGTGMYACSTCNPNGNSPTKGKCFHCHGTGRM